ncbi:MAG TPA: indole-3-glycerol phosphate synthase TrpC [Actinomycetota bacterium]|nr:indole-3-glycerol phosphate synthase TrpC [Actinomycetota bacterium]
MPSFLEQITAARHAEAEKRAAGGALDEAKAEAAAAEPPRSFAGVLGRPQLSLIAEIKRASPSAGDINASVDPVAQARAYQRGGAAAISVLTEPEYFRGSIDDLRIVHDSVAVPVLRKDFISHPLQVWEARAAGADAILLIVAALDQRDLVSLYDLAETLAMSALVETHDADEVARAVEAGARIVGINTRNLATLEVDPAVVEKVRASVPDGVTLVGESGVSSRADVEMMLAAGVDAVLVGEALMRATDPEAKVRELLGG